MGCSWGKWHSVKEVGVAVVPEKKGTIAKSLFHVHDLFSHRPLAKVFLTGARRAPLQGNDKLALTFHWIKFPFCYVKAPPRSLDLLTQVGGKKTITDLQSIDAFVS
jgi:hypothetical protein